MSKIDDDIKKAFEIEKQIQALYSQMDDLLDPIVTKVMKAENLDEARSLYRKLPRGFHRTELLTYIHKEEQKGPQSPDIGL